MSTMMLQHAVREAFERMANVYGRDFTGRWADQDDEAVTAQWVRELQQLDNPLDAIAWALRHLPTRPPNAIDFRELCLKMPRQYQQAMRAHDHTPRRGLSEFERDLFARYKERHANEPKPGSRDWAERIIARHESGAHPATPAVLAMALDAVEQRARVPHGTYEPPTMPTAPADDLPSWPELEGI